MLRVLLVEKFTSYEIVSGSNKFSLVSKERLEELKKSHDEHKSVVQSFCASLEKRCVDYELIRDENVLDVDFKNYSFIVSLGGDGTFLHAAKKVTFQVLIGVNTDLSKSHGFLTKFRSFDAQSLVERMVGGNLSVELWSRLGVRVNGEKLGFLALNEVLIGSEKIYTTTHIKVDVGALSSRFISNGIVISTQKGSSAFYKSSGGKSFRRDTLAYSVILPFKKKGNLDVTRVLKRDEVVVVVPKRQSYVLLFDCDERRKIELHQEDRVEVFIEKNDGLRVARI